MITRGNARATVFHSDEDFAQFTNLLNAALERIPIEIFAWCLMPNHVHLVVRPPADGDLARWMHWLLTTHVQRHRIRHVTTGRIWQGRYKAFPIQADTHFLTVVRYVERNPVRAGLTHTAMNWRWSSASDRCVQQPEVKGLTPPPVALPSPWIDWVDTPMTSGELDAVRLSIRHDRPFGGAAWARGVTDRLGLPGTRRPRGRPRNL